MPKFWSPGGQKSDPGTQRDFVSDKWWQNHWKTCMNYISDIQTICAGQNLRTKMSKNMIAPGRKNGQTPDCEKYGTTRNAKFVWPGGRKHEIRPLSAKNVSAGGIEMCAAAAEPCVSYHRVRTRKAVCKICCVIILRYRGPGPSCFERPGGPIFSAPGPKSVIRTTKQKRIQKNRERASWQKAARKQLFAKASRRLARAFAKSCFPQISKSWNFCHWKRAAFLGKPF